MGKNVQRIELTTEYLNSVLGGVSSREPIPYDGKININHVAMVLDIEDVCDVRLIDTKNRNGEFHMQAYDTTSGEGKLVVIPNAKADPLTTNFVISALKFVDERRAQCFSNPDDFNDEHLKKALGIKSTYTNEKKVTFTNDQLKKILDSVRGNKSISYSGKVDINDVAMIVKIEEENNVRLMGVKPAGKNCNMPVYNTNSRNTGIVTIIDYKDHKCSSNLVYSACDFMAERMNNFKKSPENITDQETRRALSMINDQRDFYNQLSCTKKIIGKYARM